MPAAAPLIAERYVRFPPKWQNVLVPAGPPRASAQATTLYSASKGATLALQRALWLAARLGGGRLLPGARQVWQAPLPAEVMAGLEQQWRAAVPASVDGLAVFERLQSFRPALVVLVCAGQHSMLVRVRRDADSMTREREISAAARRVRPSTFRVPAERGSGRIEDWHWIGYEAMSRRPHAPARSAPSELTGEISDLVESVVPRPADVPAHWRGAHTDLNPWNLRRAGRTTWLIDWEDAAWAPPGADLLYFRAVAHSLRGAPTGPMPFADEHAEAIAYWADRVRAQAELDPGVLLLERLLVLFGAR